jgi:hypothetical protein
MSTIPAPRTTTDAPARTPTSERQLGDVARALAGVGLSWSPAGRRPAALYWAMAEELAAHGLLAPIPAEPAEAADPDRPHVVDAVGRRVYSGDTVGGTTSGRYQDTVTGEVVRIGRGKVKIHVQTGSGGYRPGAGDDLWLSTGRIFLVASGQPPAPAPEPGPATALTGCCDHAPAFVFLARSVNRRVVKHLADPANAARTLCDKDAAPPAPDDLPYLPALTVCRTCLTHADKLPTCKCPNLPPAATDGAGR